MRYGLLADVHESVGWLKAVLNHLEQQSVDRLIVLGDIFETGVLLEETVELLRRFGVVGVWGNHDYGLSHLPTDDVRARYSPACLEFMTSLKPEYKFEDCLATHIEPYRDSMNLYDLWSFEDDSEIHRCFSARTNRLMFHGHHHRWKITTPDGRLPWSGHDTFSFLPGYRYVVQVAAVVDGRCGLLDTVMQTLVPIQLSPEDRIRD